MLKIQRIDKLPDGFCLTLEDGAQVVVSGDIGAAIWEAVVKIIQDYFDRL